MNYNYKSVVKNFYLKSVLLALLLLMVGCTFAQFQPTNVPGLVLWLKADSLVIQSGGLVSQWRDCSGAGTDAFATTGNQPTLSTGATINNKPTLVFNGTTSFLSGAQITGLNSNGTNCGLHIFMVSKSSTAPASGATGLFTIGDQQYGLLWERHSALGDLFVSNQHGDPANDYVYSTAAMPTNAGYPYKIFEVKKIEGSNVKLYANTVSTQLGNATNAALIGPFTNAAYNIGFAAGTTNYFNGEIAEILVFNVCLTTPQIQQIESYLAYKYSPPLLAVHDTVSTHNLCAITLAATSGYTGFHWSTGATTQTISVNKTGTYTVSATDGFTIQHVDSVHVTFPAISLNTSATLCQGSTLELVPHVPTFNNYTFLWSNGQTTDSISVSVGGSYKVTVTDAVAHCMDTTNAEIISVDAFQSTVSLGPATTLCGGNKIGLTGPLTGWNRLHFHWSTGSIDSFIWINPPSATYSVTVTDTIGCSGTASVSVTIAGTAPHVNFTTNPVCQGLAYTPYNLSDSVNVRYAWVFGDGGTDTLRFPSHIYHTAGTYYVKLTVSNPTTGCSNDTTIPIVINALPTAKYQSAVACNGILYTFDNLSGAATGQSIASYFWDFKDLANPLTDTSSSQTPYYTYSTVGVYYAVLTVIQANGCMAIDSTDSIYVQPPSAVPAAPLLEFPASGSISASGTITFGWGSAAGASYYNLLVSPDPTFSSQDSNYYNIYTNQITVTLPPNQTYYWKVTAVNPCGIANLSLIDTVIVFSPSNLGNVAFWVRADNGVVLSGNNVSQWKDQSPGASIATSAGTTPPTLLPQVTLLNRMPSVKFANGSFLTGSALASLGGNGATCQNSLSMFVVAKANGAITEPEGIFTIGGLNTGMWLERGNGFAFINYYYNNQAPNHLTDAPVLSDTAAMPNRVSPYRLLGISKNTGSFARIDTNGTYDKSNFNTFTIGPFTDSTYNIGHCAGTDPYSGDIPYGYLNGEIAEIIIYNTLLGQTDIQQVNDYLFNKYAPPVNLGPDIVQTYSLCPVTLRTGSRFVSYKWSTGATSDTLNVTQGGTYWVKTIDVFNRTSVDSIQITLPYQGPNPDILNLCHGDSGQIAQLISSPGSYTYIWYDSTSPSTVVNMNINSNIAHVGSAGFYYSKITDNAHCSIITKKVPVIMDNFYSAQLLPDFDTICRNGTLVINPTTYTIDSFLWQPLNDTTSSPYIPASGTYYLSTVDNHGCKNLDSVSIITRAQAPLTNFTVPNLCLSNTTYFIDSSFAAPGDSITSYLWNYGGGTPSTDTTINGQTSYRFYYGYGNYTVTLKLTTDSGCVGIKTRHISILPSPNAGFSDSANNSVYPYIVCAGSNSSAQFTDISAEVGGSPITQRFWKFDGVVNANTNSTIQYSFPTQGAYNITLEVINSIGCADSITQQIQVYPAFTADFNYTNHCLGDVSSFTDLTQSLSIVSRIWKFRENGDGPYAYTPSTQITFAQPGTYDVQLQVENAIGCVSIVDHRVKIVQSPSANFTDLITCIGQTYSPLDSSFAYGDTLVQWNWNIGGHLSNLPSPSAVFNSPGQQVVSLKVTSSEGCVDSVTKVIEVAPVPTALFAFTPQYGTAPLTVNFSNRSTGANSYAWHFGDGSSIVVDSPYINPPAHTYTVNGNYDIVLYAYNHYGCYDSFARLITVIPTNLDLAVELVSARSVTQPDGNELVTLTAYISNVGTRIINSAQLYATLGGAGIMEQNWNGYLLSGQSILDTFPAQFVVPQGSTNTYVCVRAISVNDGETETDTTNNQNCASLSGTMQLAGPLPNPAITSSELGIIMPKAGTVYISIIDELGKPVVPEASFNLPVGRTNYIIPVAQLQSAEYFIRVRYNDDNEVRKFVVR